MTMSEVARERSGWVFRPTSPEFVGTMATVAAAGEIAVRAAAGVVGVRVVTGLVRDHPLLSILLATGLGYVFGNGWHVRRGQAAAAQSGGKRRT
jgi:hypothetical protein